MMKKRHIIQALVSGKDSHAFTAGGMGSIPESGN